MAAVDKNLYTVTVYAHQATQPIAVERFHASTLEEAKTRFAPWCQADKYYAASLSSDDGKVVEDWLDDPVQLENVRKLRQMRADYRSGP